MHSLAQIHSILDDRVQTQKQLAVVYGRWLDQVKRQHQIVGHLILQSIAFIAFLLLCAALIAAAIRKLLDRLHLGHRNLQTLRTVTSLGIQLITALLVLLVIFGAPSQMPTILGLATAGLTVVFQDFILAFFGWFVLMGKNGIRVGDVVEINGVGGEVVEVGIFRTSLLETGNWTDKGHPTGRRVSFTNSFAIRGQYFNFSTSGQWLWDEIRLNIPAGPNTYQIIEEIHKAVQQETAETPRRPRPNGVERPAPMASATSAPRPRSTSGPRPLASISSCATSHGPKTASAYAIASINPSSTSCRRTRKPLLSNREKKRTNTLELKLTRLCHAEHSEEAPCTCSSSIADRPPSSSPSSRQTLAHRARSTKARSLASAPATQPSSSEMSLKAISSPPLRSTPTILSKQSIKLSMQ
jgi:hypothetical protein